MIRLLELIKKNFPFILIKVKKKVIIIGMALKELGYITEAISMYDLALRINPNDATLYYNKGIYLYYFLKA